ncbi:cytochrome b [Marinobacterium zhoushanense]|uniref:Cytochrome b n=1 Tax=Marinobacterium zhoushanense TaxID=1679163 RepID=A0ABQ1KQL8_9GAMM|nr:cytochrome b [Marinobacterium zhoushanense]
MAKLLHWLMAALLLIQLLLGAFALIWPLSPTKLQLFIWHKSLGLLLLVLVLIRLAWRWLNPVPRLPSSVPPWQRLASQLSHLTLYVCLIALPITGWVINSASNVPLKVFWLFRLPNITEPDKALEQLMKWVHGGFVMLFLLVLVVHIAAALHHHFVRHDEVLTRMLPGRSR